jgi:rubrerythrin
MENSVFTFEDIIDLAVRIEQNGRDSYRKAMKKISDPHLSAVLNRLATDETEHEKWFTTLRKQVKSINIDPELEEMGKAMLQNVLGDQAFSIADADFSKIENIKELLELSIEFEMDTILFYEMILAFIEDEKTINSLNDIIKEENRHIIQLTGWLENAGLMTIG